MCLATPSRPARRPASTKRLNPCAQSSIIERHFAMTIDPTTQTLAQLGDTEPGKVVARFGEVRNRFDADVARHTSPGELPNLLSAWVGRKSGALTRIGDN